MQIWSKISCPTPLIDSIHCASSVSVEFTVSSDSLPKRRDDDVTVLVTYFSRCHTLSPTAHSGREHTCIDLIVQSAAAVGHWQPATFPTTVNLIVLVTSLFLESATDIGFHSNEMKSEAVMF